MASRFLLVAWLSLAAFPALGARLQFAAPTAGSTFVSGDEVMLRWSNAPAAAREMELLLSVDGGRHFSIRLTHELSGKATSYLWRVPELPASVARLALRANLGGREVEIGESAPFAITADSGSQGPQGSIGFVRGEIWWLEQTVAGSEADDLALAGLDPFPTEPCVLPVASEAMIAELHSPEGAPRPGVDSSRVPVLLAVSPPFFPRYLATSAPRISPLRI